MSRNAKPTWRNNLFREVLAMMAWNVICVAVFSIILFFLVFELRTWLSDRKVPSQAVSSRGRWLRRTFGLFLLLGVLILLRFPAESNLSPLLLLIKMTVCLLLCLVLIIVVIWDSRSILRDLRTQSAQDLRMLLEESCSEICGQEYFSPEKREEEAEPSGSRRSEPILDSQDNETTKPTSRDPQKPSNGSSSL